MININLVGLAPLLYQLTLWELLVVVGKPVDVDRSISGEIQEQILGWLKVAAAVAKDFENKAAHDRVAIFRGLVERGTTHRVLSVECRVLRETIEGGLKEQLLYRYNDEQALVLKRWQEDWAIVISKFPSTKRDIYAAIDCWALGHGTSAVFHLMRVLEHGVVALARDVNVDAGTQTWQPIIDQIEAQIRALGKTLLRGEEKNKRLQFLSEAAKEIVYFKDGWRNYVSHNHGTYDSHQARSVMEHVRSFMSVLSQRLSEVPSSTMQVP